MEPLEPLRQFLIDNLTPEPAKCVADNEVITEAVVIYRVSLVDGPGEYYRYSVTQGVNLAMAIGMLDLTQQTMHHYYNHILTEEGDDDDG